MALVEWLNKYALAVQAGTAIVIAFLTWALIHWTRKYANANIRLVKVMERDLEARTQPHLRLLITQTSDVAAGVFQYQVMLSNEGQGAAVVQSLKAEWKCLADGEPLATEQSPLVFRTPYSVKAGGGNTGWVRVKISGHTHPEERLGYEAEVLYEDVFALRRWRLTSSSTGEDRLELLTQKPLIP